MGDEIYIFLWSFCAENFPLSLVPLSVRGVRIGFEQFLELTLSDKQVQITFHLNRKSFLLLIIISISGG